MIAKIQNAEEIFELGNFYRLNQDWHKAKESYEQAALLGHHLAQRHLGMMYKRGISVSQDFKQAFYWFNESSNGGNNAGKFELGQLYRYGEGVKKDEKQAVKYYGDIVKIPITEVELDVYTKAMHALGYTTLGERMGDCTHYWSDEDFGEMQTRYDEEDDDDALESSP